MAKKTDVDRRILDCLAMGKLNEIDSRDGKYMSARVRDKVVQRYLNEGPNWYTTARLIANYGVSPQILEAVVDHQVLDCLAKGTLDQINPRDGKYMSTKVRDQVVQRYLNEGPNWYNKARLLADYGVSLEIREAVIEVYMALYTRHVLEKSYQDDRDGHLALRGVMRLIDKFPPISMKMKEFLIENCLHLGHLRMATLLAKHQVGRILTADERGQAKRRAMLIKQLKKDNQAWRALMTISFGLKHLVR